MPQRIQRSRALGWRMPEGAVYVGRSTKWGNPFRPGDLDDEGNPMDTAAAMECYAAYVQLSPDLAESARLLVSTRCALPRGHPLGVGEPMISAAALGP